MDLGCHGIAFCWWLLGKPNVRSVYAQLATQVHANRTQGDDERSRSSSSKAAPSA
jgi:predicted dehydrogenase